MELWDLVIVSVDDGGTTGATCVVVVRSVVVVTIGGSDAQPLANAVNIMPVINGNDAGSRMKRDCFKNFEKFFDMGFSPTG